MGFSLPDLNLKGMSIEDKGMSVSTIEPLGKKGLASRALRCGLQKKLRLKRNIGIHRYCHGRPRKIMMKRRASSKRPRRSLNVGGLERRLQVLAELVNPNGNSMCSLDGLFMEVADYIMHLEMQVKVMQIMVKALSDSN